MKINELPFNILDVAKLTGLRLIEEKGHGSSFDAICPYCGAGKGKFNIAVYNSSGERKDVFKCFGCGASGNMLRLYGDYAGYNADDKDDRKKICKEIIANLGINFNKPKPQTQVVLETKPEIFVPTGIKDAVFRELLSLCSLKISHKKDLLRRGLSEEQIEKGLFKSVPDNTKYIARQMKSSLYGVPGFFINDNVWDMSNISGYFCPAYDTNGFITGLQIRRDNNKEPKYLWFSSTDKTDNPKPYGTKQYSKATFLGNVNASEVIITEGILKAYVYYSLTNNTIIGVPGINNINCLDSILDNMPYLTHIKIAFDMDKIIYPICDSSNCNNCKGLNNNYCIKKIKKRKIIQDAEKTLADKLIKKGYKVTSLYWDYTYLNNKKIWLGNYKGIDDFTLWQRGGV